MSSVPTSVPGGSAVKSVTAGGLRPTNQSRAASGCAAFGYGVRWTWHVPVVDLACTWLAIQAYSHLRADWDGPSANPQSSINLCLHQQAASA